MASRVEDANQRGAHFVEGVTVPTKPYLSERERAAMGKRLKAARMVLGMTEQEAAREVHVHRASIQGWERGTVPRPQSRRRLARVYGIEERVLFREFEHRLQAALRDTDGRSK